MFNRLYYFIKIFLLNHLITIILNLQCGREEIDHCAQCGTGENSDTCVKCENNYFLFLSNLLCIPCDHEYYGNIGCGGNCDSSKYKEINNIFVKKINVRRDIIILKESVYNVQLDLNIVQNAPI